MKTAIKKLVLVSLLLAILPIEAQVLTLDSANSKVSVLGTSNLHDWELDATKIRGTATWEMKEGVLAGISKLTLLVDAEGLKSGKSGMDKNTYKALQTDRHKTISYELTQVQHITTKSNNQYRVEAQGKLSIAGTTQRVVISFDLKKRSSNSYEVVGQAQIDMTRYKVDPPTAVMGTIKTGKDVTINFQLIYK